MNDLLKELRAYYEKKHYIGLAGVLRFIADGFIFAAVVWYCIAAGGLLPLYVKDYGSLGSDKALFWMSSYNTPFKLLILGAAFLLSAFLVKLVTVEGAGPSFFERIKKTALFTVITPTHVWGCLFLTSVLFSYIFSEYKEIALRGETGWYCGTEEYVVIVLCLFVVALSGFGERIFPAVILLSSAAVFVLGIGMDLFGNILSLESWNTSKVSTVGNANWFCGYMVVTFFYVMALYFFRAYEKVKFPAIAKNLLRIYLFAGAYMYVMNGSSGGYVPLMAVFVIFLLFCKKDPEKLFIVSEMGTVMSLGVLAHCVALGLGAEARSNDSLGELVNHPMFGILLFGICMFMSVFLDMKIKKGMNETRFYIGRPALYMILSLALVFIMLLTVNTLSGGAFLGVKGPLFFNRLWGNCRGITMEAGVRIFGGFSFREMLFGTGPDTFYSVYSGGRYPELAETLKMYFGESRLINAHCEPLTMLVNTGIFGTVTFYGMLISFIIKGLKQSPEAGRHGITALGTSLCVTGYVINNLFSFQTSVNLSQLSLMLAFGTAAVLKAHKQEKK